MRIIKETDSEDCFGGGFIKEYRLDRKTTMGFVRYMESFGEVTVIKGMRKPFYSFDKERFFAIKGVVGKDMIKVIFRRENADITRGFLDVLLECYESGTQEPPSCVGEAQQRILDEMAKREKRL